LLGLVPAPASAGQAASGQAAAGCAAVAAGRVSCAGLLTPGRAAVKAAALRAAAATPAGLSPADLQDAYGFQSSSAGMRQTVAVVTAYDDPTAETDMGTYRSEYGLPSCTTADECFSKVNQAGGTSYPAANPQWTLVTAQSLDMISAVCPNCHILLVEADSTSITSTASGTASDLGQAEDEAVALGAKFITNTFFTPEFNGETADDVYFDHPGVEITAADGLNTGYGTFYPAASPYVTAVGGTTLTASSTAPRGWTETAYSGTGSGCSPYEAKPLWQADTGCSTRTLNDVSAVADNDDSPVALYDTTSGGWVTGGGQAVAAAIIAAAYALAGTPAADSNPMSYLYANVAGLNDITTGSDGTCSPAPAYYCTAGTGYDGPTGLGTPASTIPFSSSGASRVGAISSGIFGKCLDNYEAGTTSGNKVDIYTCNTDSGAQDWTVESDGTIRIQGKCLDNSHSGTASNNPVDLYACNGTGAQQWRPRYPDELENPETGKCLNDPSSNTTNGTQLVIYTCNQTGAQDWFLPYSTPTSTGEVTSGISGKCLDNSHAGTAAGNVVDLYACNGGSGSQEWTVEADGTIQILGMCLDDSHSGTANGTLVDLYTCNGTGAQQWRPQSDGSLLNPATGKCLDDPHSNTTDGTQLDIYTCNETDAQVWTLPS
jgi:hypothetical protein